MTKKRNINHELEKLASVYEIRWWLRRSWRKSI